MQKPKNVVPISAGHVDFDPEHFTISVGSIPFRFRMGPSGRSTMIGPARLIDFPGADVWKKLANSAQGSGRIGFPQYRSAEGSAPLAV
jgi:hypothetical protein